MSHSQPREVDDLIIRYQGRPLDLETLRAYLHRPSHPLHLPTSDASMQTDPISSAKGFQALKVLSIRDIPYYSCSSDIPRHSPTRSIYQI